MRDLKLLTLAGLLAGLTLHACNCSDETEALEEQPRDASTPDRVIVDTGIIPAECTFATDCPEPYPPCNATGGCGCGTFKTCLSGQCLVFSQDCPADGGLAFDAGRFDAGEVPADAGQAACETAAQCTPNGDRIPPPDPPVGFCSSYTAESCVDGSCLQECNYARTCLSDRAGCLSCRDEQGEQTYCPNSQACFPGANGAALVESGTCGAIPGTNEPLIGSRLELTRQPNVACEFAATLVPSGYALGSFSALDEGWFLGYFPGLGGTCTGVALPTGVYRVAWSCPDCQLILAYQ